MSVVQDNYHCTNGALVVPNGGAGIGGALNVCGTGHFYSTGDAFTCGDGTVRYLLKGALKSPKHFWSAELEQAPIVQMVH